MELINLAENCILNVPEVENTIFVGFEDVSYSIVTPFEPEVLFICIGIAVSIATFN